MKLEFQTLVAFYRKCEFIDNSDEAFFTPVTMEDISLIRQLIVANADSGIQLAGDATDSDIKINQRIRLILDAPRIGFGRLFENTTNLIKLFPKPEPAEYYIRELDFYSCDEEVPDLIKKYRNILTLLDFLKSIGAYYDETAQSIIFVVEQSIFRLNVGRFSIEVQELENLAVNVWINEIAKILVEDTYQQNRINIFIKALGDFLSEKPIDINDFIYVLKNIDKLDKTYKKRVEVFLANFSYDKIVDQLKTVQIEETGKIHKVFSDIQNHVLAIPIASLLAISQMKKPDESVTFGIVGMTNLFIASGVSIFIMLIWLLLFNQYSTLKTIESELTSRESKFKQEPKYQVLVEDSQINAIFKNLSTRMRVQKIALFCIALLSIICLLVSWMYYLYLNHPSEWNMFYSSLLKIKDYFGER